MHTDIYACPTCGEASKRVSEDFVESDVFLTGEVNFLANALSREEKDRENLWLSIALYVSVLAAEAFIVILLLLVPTLFRRRMLPRCRQNSADQECRKLQ